MNNNKKSLLSQFQKLQKVGEGLTSTVYKAGSLENNFLCLKVINKTFYAKPIGKLLIDNQIKILKQINHKNLLKIQKHEQNQQQNIIITDFCEGGNLYELTKKCNKFTEDQTLIIVQGIVNGLQYLYNKKIIHRDLKPENIFFKKGQPIIADFGFAVHLGNTALNKVNAGSPLYMSPQTLEHLDFSIQSEIFAIGVIIFEMLKGKTPWSAISQQQLLKNMLTLKPSLQISNKKFENIILKCLEPKKQNRPKFSQIQKFFNQWKNQRFDKVAFLYDVKNIKKIKNQQKDKKASNHQKLNLNRKAQKQNIVNQTVIHSKTHRLSVETKSHCRNRSVIMTSDRIKTKRNKSQKLDNDFKLILGRLDPQQMKFLPSSMIQKFKFILQSYSRLIDSNEQSDQRVVLKSLKINKKPIPLSLKNDKITTNISQIKDQRQFCQSISAYIGRMYRLAKNYKIYENFISDIQIVYQRVESFC